MLRGRSVAPVRPPAAPAPRAGGGRPLAWPPLSCRSRRFPSRWRPCHSRAMEDRVSAALLAWYDRHARASPWRAPPGSPPPEPYRVWLSEIMLQQTPTVHAAPYYEKFLAGWPSVE